MKISETIRLVNNDGEKIRTIVDDMIDLLRNSEMDTKTMSEILGYDEQYIITIMDILVKHGIVEEGGRYGRYAKNEKVSYLDKLKGEILG